MRKILRYLNPSFVKRINRISKKKKARIERVKKVIAELNEWDDIPLSYQFTGLCKTLHIKPDEASYNFIKMLCFPNVNIEAAAKKLPLI